MKQEDLCVRDICQPISVEIVTPDDCHPKITAFNLSDEVVTMLEPLQNLFESNIFMNLWSVIGHQANSASLEEVCENVWKPVSTKMEEITRKLVTGEIQFEEMEKYMGEVYQEDYNKMVYEMTIIKVPKEQADERIKQLRQFRQLETCFDGAKAISDLAKAYGLKGDLDVIKPFISQKHATKMMMKEFDDSLLKTSDILQTFIAERTACLNAFIDCKQLVLWIRESVKDLKELKVFVDLALISAGDREMEIARVNCLHAAITGFAPLIFCLDENSGYELLLDKCQILWKELESVPNLPQKLRDTQCHLEWLKTVKQAHGSVEITSLAEAEAINSNGIFLLGALGTSENARMVLKTFSMKCQQCNEHLSDDAVFCFNCGTAVSEPIILCSGKKKDGTPCGSRLQEGHKFCMKCGSPVNQGKQTLCKGVMKDGSTCSNLLKEEAEFCLNCGTAPGAKPSEVLSLCAKSDAENGPDNINMQQDSAFRFPVSSSPRPNEEIVKPSLFPIHSLPQSRSISENVKKNSLDGESQDMKREMKFKRKQVKKKNLDISNPCCLESLKDIQESPQKLVEKIDEKTADNSQPADTLEKGSIDHVHAVKEKVTIQETGNEINSDKDESENTENGHAVDDERTENQGKEIAPIQETRNGINSVMDKSENTGNGQVLSGKRTERIGASALETQSNTLVKEQVKESMEPEVGNLKKKKETGRRPKQNSKNLNMQQKHKVPVAKTTEVEEDKK